MSPPGGPRCPPALLALLLALVRSQELQECRERAVTAGGSLCLVPEEPAWEWREMHWRGEMDSGSRWRILAATRNEDVLDPKSPFHGRAEIHLGIFSLCLSPVHKADSGVYTAEFEDSSGNFSIFPQCFRVSVWDPIPEPSLQSQILEWDRGWCLLSLLCCSPGNGNVSISWECPEEPPESPKSPKSPKSPFQRFQWVPEDAEPQMCLCNLSNAAGWRAALTPLTCTGFRDPFSGNFHLRTALAVDIGQILLIVLICVCWICWRWRKRRRKENSREDPSSLQEIPPVNAPLNPTL